jgi:hypothetical protein
MSTSAVSAAVVWQSTVTKAGIGSGGPSTPTTSLLRECIDWLERVECGELVAVNLSEASERETEYVPVDRPKYVWCSSASPRISNDKQPAADPSKRDPELRVEIAWLI